MLICLVSGMGECFAVLVFSFALAELVWEAVSLLHSCSELKAFVLYIITKLQLITQDALWGIKNFWERNGPVYAFLWVLKGHFRHVIVFSFPAASTWERGLCKLQKINMLLHTVPFSIFLGCVKIAAEIKKSCRKVILTVYSLHIDRKSVV